jgi:GNAT superfamily N-acetyltransferase
MNDFWWRTVTTHPPVELCIHKVDRSLWSRFSRHHYLSADINSSAQCFGGFIGCDLVAFMAYLHFPHSRVKDIKMGHRAVVLPDFQGLGISGRMSEWIGQDLYRQGYRYRRVIAHPAVIAYCAASPRWKENHRSVRSARSWSAAAWDVEGERTPIRRVFNPRVLMTRSFEYVPVRP